MVLAERRSSSLAILDAISGLNLPKGATQLLQLNWLLTPEGLAHDLSDTEALSSLLHDWAPDIGKRAQDVQSTMHWVALQGPNRDNLRHWSFRGLMLDHWSTILGDLGVSPRDATATLDNLECAILKTVPSIWNSFATAIHEASGSDPTKTSLTAAIDLFFQDWASDQPEPIPITRREVESLTMRAKRRWLAKRRRELQPTIERNVSYVLYVSNVRNVRYRTKNK